MQSVVQWIFSWIPPARYDLCGSQSDYRNVAPAPVLAFEMDPDVLCVGHADIQ